MCPRVDRGVGQTMLDSIQSLLITGSCGFIGMNLVSFLLERYPHLRVCAVDKLDYNSNREATRASCPRHTFIEADICDEARMLQLLREHHVELVLHLAAQSHVDRSLTHPYLFLRDNVQGTLALLEAARQYQNLRLFLHFSTDEVYGDNGGAGDQIFHEASPLRPTNPYSATKASAEMLVHAYRTSFRIPAIITRCNNVYGPGQYQDKLIPRCIERIQRGVKCLVHGTGQQMRNFVHVRDVCRAVETIVASGRRGEVYNIGSQCEKTILQVIELLLEQHHGAAVDVASHVEFIEDRPYNDQRYLIDDQKLRALGWRESVSFREGLRALWAPPPPTSQPP